MKLCPLILPLDPQPFVKTRLGNPDGDGGYVVCHIPGVPYDYFFSAGIGGEDSFEQDVCKKYPGIVGRAYDDVCGVLPHGNVGDFAGVTCTVGRNFPLLIPQDKSFVLVKMDIEGGEYEAFKDATDGDMRKIAQLVVELHSVSKHMWLLEKLWLTHWPVHTHANNVSGFDGLPDGTCVPKFLEMTFLRKDLCFGIPSTAAIPDPVLDRPNVKNLPELVLIEAKVV